MYKLYCHILASMLIRRIDSVYRFAAKGYQCIERSCDIESTIYVYMCI